MMSKFRGDSFINQNLTLIIPMKVNPEGTSWN